jgi:hypothetical protein
MPLAPALRPAALAAFAAGLAPALAEETAP